MEEIPNNHLTCIKPCIFHGLCTISTGDSQDFWTINRSTTTSGVPSSPVPCFSKCWSSVLGENIWKAVKIWHPGRTYPHGSMTMTPNWERCKKKHNQLQAVEIDPGNWRSSIIVYTKTSDDGCWMDVELCTKSSIKTSKTSDVEWMSIRSNLYKKKKHIMESSIPELLCLCFPFKKANPRRKTHLPSKGISILQWQGQDPGAKNMLFSWVQTS